MDQENAPLLEHQDHVDQEAFPPSDSSPTPNPTLGDYPHEVTQTEAQQESLDLKAVEEGASLQEFPPVAEERVPMPADTFAAGKHISSTYLVLVLLDRATGSDIHLQHAYLFTVLRMFVQLVNS